MQVPPPPLPPPPPPAPFSATPPARRSPRRWWVFGCGGLGAIALIVVLVLVVVLISSFANSPLRHFPTEAGAATLSDQVGIANGQSGETVVIDDPHSLQDVETYYQSALNTNGWTVQATDPSQAVSGDGWPFSRSGSSAQFGITFVTKGPLTEITVQYVS